MSRMKRRITLLVAFLVAAVAALPGAVAGAASSPAVATGVVSSVTSSAAMLHGTVNPNGAATHYSFQWGLTKAYGASSSLKSAGKGSTVVSVQAKAAGLLPGTTYHYRLVASNTSGGTSGAGRTFKTAGHPPPAAVTGSIAGIGHRNVTLTGVVYPHGAATTYLFQWGRTTAYGLQTIARIAAKGKPISVSERLGGLAPGTAFHYRIVALHNGSIAGYGADAMFVTLPLHRRHPRLRAKVAPHRIGHRPFVFMVTGQLIDVPSATAFARCPGTVGVTLFWHGRSVGHRLIPVATDCKFSARAAVRRLPGAAGHHAVRLRVRIRFRGNGYLKPASARGGHVVIR
jgi:hypothetical protein